MSSPIAKLAGDFRGPSAEPAVVEVAGDDAETMLDALGSDTARSLFRSVHDDPAPPSVLADRVDTSVQNVHYHLSNLVDAGVVEVVGTRYSAKGNEMRIYGPAADPIVLIGAAGEAERAAIRSRLTDWATGVATLAMVALAVQFATERFAGDVASGIFEPASRGVARLTGIPALAETVAEPGLLFFLGGFIVLTVAVFRDFELDW